MATKLNEMLKKLIDQYASELTEARATENYKRPSGALVRKDIASNIQAQVDDKIYKVKGSVGAGRWTDVPWIAVFDKRITISAQRGEYIVYLLNKDTKELFLTLNQGATDMAQGGGDKSDGKLTFTGVATASSEKMIEMLLMRAKEIREGIGSECNLQYGQINTGSKAYDAGCVYYKKYDLSSMPEEKELYRDLSEFIGAYCLYYEKMFNTQKKHLQKEGKRGLSIQETLEQIKNYIAWMR